MTFNSCVYYIHSVFAMPLPCLSSKLPNDYLYSCDAFLSQSVQQHDGLTQLNDSSNDIVTIEMGDDRLDTPNIFNFTSETNCDDHEHEEVQTVCNDGNVEDKDNIDLIAEEFLGQEQENDSDLIDLGRRDKGKIKRQETLTFHCQSETDFTHFCSESNQDEMVPLVHTKIGEDIELLPLVHRENGNISGGNQKLLPMLHTYAITLIDEEGEEPTFV